MSPCAPTEFGRDLCGDARVSVEREWLVTNGIGGFASGSIADVLTRRYHGLLFAALKPPLGRTLLLAKLDASAVYDGRTYDLSANRWGDGTLSPNGYRTIERFGLEGSIPTWTYTFSDVVLGRSIWMEHGENTTFVRYEVLEASRPLELSLKALVNARDYHSLSRAYDAGNAVTISDGSARVQLNPQAPALFLTSDRGETKAVGEWYFAFRLDAERDRGLDDIEDHYHAVTIFATLLQGQSITIAASTEPIAPNRVDSSRPRRMARDVALVDQFGAVRRRDAAIEPWIEQLVLASDQFIVERATGGERGQTIIAGYPWFGDWGRDTMIALPGLTLATGRASIARAVLTTFARFLDRGMLPNRFPDGGEAPEYNTVDATLWYVEAIRRYFEATSDDGIVVELFPVLREIVEWHAKGTRYHIGVDPADGLLYAGESGVQLTWMDAKVGDDVITPRTGKAVEINALWYSALMTVASFARRTNADAAAYETLAQQVRDSFERFWNGVTGYCFDTLDGPEGNDPSIRPNAVVAASLPQTPLSAARCRAIVEVASRELATSFGLRSLSPGDSRYRGRYEGGPAQRDAAYHQGTIWPWLLGPFVSAHFKAYRDPARALSLLAGIKHAIRAYGVGTLAEIAEGDAPYAGRGCIAQAWSVAEILRAWQEIQTPFTSVPKSTRRRSIA
jgi:predicted glycogen debranching enzyme